MTEKIEYTLYNILLDILNISTDVGESVDPSLESNVSLHYRFSCNDNSYQIKWMLYWIEYGICGIRFPLQSISLIDGETIETIAFAVRFGDDGTCDCDDPTRKITYTHQLRGGLFDGKLTGMVEGVKTLEQQKRDDKKLKDLLVQMKMMA